MPVGHCSGATGLDVLAGHEAFALHPLMTVPAQAASRVFAGAGAAVAGSTPRALALAEELAARLGHAPDDRRRRGPRRLPRRGVDRVELPRRRSRERRSGWRAAPGSERELLAPLVRAAVENWARLGAADALTGPIARGDQATVARQRAAVAERAPDLVELFDALVDATRALAGAAR